MGRGGDVLHESPAQVLIPREAETSGSSVQRSHDVIVCNWRAPGSRSWKARFTSDHSFPARLGWVDVRNGKAGPEIDRYHCLLVTLPLEFVLRARVYRRLPTLLWALVPVVVVFSVWDVAGILREHWTYNARYVSGLRLLLGMPVEELVFFIVVPICGLLSYEAVGYVLGLVRNRRRSSQVSESAGASRA